MYTDKDSNLISDLRTKYGEESVRLFRKWENIVKKMVDYRNHRRFTIKCIKASITPVSCKLKNPLLHKSSRSYQIIHKAEKQLLYERIRNINSILATLDKKRENVYQKFKDTLDQNNLDHEQYVDRSRTFIYRIKEHRHDKIKRKHIDKFKKLFFKRYGYHHNLSRHNTSFGNIDHNLQGLSGQSNVPSNFPTRPTNHSPHQHSCHTHGPHTFHPHSSHPTSGQPTSTWATSFQTYMYQPHGQMGQQSFQNPPHSGTIITSTERAQLCHYPQIPPIEAYITSTEQVANKLSSQDADELRSDVNRILK